MAFSDPQSITVNAVAQSLARGPNRDATTSSYNKDDGSYTLLIGNQLRSTRNRFTVRVDHTKLTTDPFVSANNIRVSSSVYLVLDVPVLGYTNAEIKDIALGLTGWSNSTNLLKVLGKEI